MKRAEVDAELSVPEAQELLDRSDAHLAYLAKDGTPRVIPIGIFWTGTQVVMATATMSPKVAAMQQRPDVAINIDSGNTPGTARSLSLRGRAEIEIVDGVVDEYLAAAYKSMGEDGAAEFERNVRAMYPQMARIAVTPQWARFYDFGAGRIPKFLQELADRSSA